MPEYEFVKYEELEEGKIVRILLDRPDTRNAQNRGMLVELDDAFRRGREGRRRPGGHPRRRRPAVLLGARHGLGQGRSRSSTSHPTSKIDGATREGAENRMLQEWHYFFQNTLRWRNLRKITIAQVQGTVYRRRADAHVGLRPDRGGRQRLLRRRGGHPARHVRGRVLRPPLGVRSPQGQGAHADRRRHRRRGGAPARHGVEDLPDRRAGRADPELRPADRRAAHDGGAAHQGVGEPDRRQHGLLQLAAGLLHPAPAEPRPLGRGPREQVPGGACPRTGSPTGGTPPPVLVSVPDAVEGPSTKRQRPSAAGSGSEAAGLVYIADFAPVGPDRAAVVMGGSGRGSPIASSTSGRSGSPGCCTTLGLRRGDHYAVLLENHPAYFEMVWAGHALGSLHHRGQLAPHRGRGRVHRRRLRGQGPGHQRRARPTWPRPWSSTRPGVRAPPHGRRRPARRPRLLRGAAVAAQPARPPWRASRRGMVMLYSSGTTGRPKGIKFPLPPADSPLGEWEIAEHSRARYGFGEDMVFLSPAPLYHAAPLRVAMAVQSVGGTVVVMERFDPAAALALDRARAGHPQPVGAHDVRPHAEAAPKRSGPATTCPATGWPPTPPRPARCTSRSR